MSKKVVSLLLTLCMILSVFSCVTVSADTTGTPVVTLTKENVSVTNVSGTYWLMLASYDDNGLVDAKKIQISEDYQSSIADTGLNIEGATSMKAMIWESLENIKAVTGDTKFDMNTVYKVSFKSNGGTGTAAASLTGKWGETVTLPENGSTKTGYKFAGWILGADLYQPGDEYTIKGDAAFTASWTATAEEFKVNFEETVYFGTSSNGAETGTLSKNTTGRKDLYRNYETSAYYAKIDVDKYTNIKGAHLNIYVNKFNNDATLTVYDVDGEAYETAFAAVESGSEFNTADLPAGTSVTSKSYTTTDNVAHYAAPIDITNYIAGKAEAGEKYAYIMIKNTASGNSTTDAARVTGFYDKAYISIVGEIAPMATFAANGGTGDEMTPVYGETVTLPECTYTNGDYDFIGWSDGVDVYQAGAEYTMPGDKEFTAVWGYAAYASFTTDDAGVVGTMDVISVNKGDTLVLPSKGMSKPAKVGSYTLYGWNDGSVVYPVGTEYVMDDDANFTPVWVYTGVDEATVDFDRKSLLEMGKYDTTTAAYDNTVKTRKDNVTGTASVNARMTKGNDGYRVRPYIYVSVDLTNEMPAESVLLNITAARSGSASNNSIQVKAVDGIPSVGDAFVTGSAVGSLTLSTTPMTDAVDITEAYNAAVGKTLYLQVYGWAYANDKAENYVTLDVDALNLTVSAKSNVEVSFDMGAEAINDEAGTTITLPECTATVDGQVFAGWTDGSENVYPAGSEYTVPAYNVTLKAVWATAVTITFDNCEGIETVKVVQGSPVTLPIAERTAKVGTYTHTGWTDGTATYAPGESYIATEDKALTAVWNYTGATASYAQSEYINYKDSATTATKDGSGTAKKNATVSTNFARPLPYYIYYKFDITNVKNVTSATFTLDKMQSKTGTIKTYIYGIDESDYLAFSEMIGSSATVTEDQLPQNATELLASYDITVRATSSEYKAATFDVTSYVQEQIAEGKDYIYLKFAVSHSSTSYKADQGVINPDATFNITTGDAIPAYFSNGVNPVYATAGTEITLPDCTEVERGKVFTGWTDGTTTYAAGSTYTLDAPVMFKAVIADGYTVDLEGETYRSYLTALQTGEDTIVLPSIDDAPEGYVHYGWTPDNGTTLYAAGSEYVVTGDITLTAVYTKDFSFTDWYQQNANTEDKTVPTLADCTFTHRPTEMTMLGRATDTAIWTELDITGLDSDIFKASINFVKQWNRNGSTKLNVYPVTGDYVETFGEIADGATNTRGAITDISGLVLGSSVGVTGKLTGKSTAGSSTNNEPKEYTLTNFDSYLETQAASGNTSLKLAFKLIGGNATVKGLYYWNTAESPVTIRVYTLAGAEAITAAE